MFQKPVCLYFNKSHKPQTMEMWVYPQASERDKRLSTSQVSHCTLNIKRQGLDDIQLAYHYPLDGKEKKGKDYIYGIHLHRRDCLDYHSTIKRWIRSQSIPSMHSGYPSSSYVYSLHQHEHIADNSRSR